jgi:hypothetical protein
MVLRRLSSDYPSQMAIMLRLNTSAMRRAVEACHCNRQALECATSASRPLQRRFLQSNAATTAQNSTGVSTRLKPDATSEERYAYLRWADSEMEKYHDTKELLRQGKLPSRSAPHLKQQRAAHMVQAAILAAFLVAFITAPFVGKRMARDEEFRKAWSWFDYTLEQKTKPWTREELEEQSVAVQKLLEEKIRSGELTAESWRRLRGSLQGLEYLENSLNSKSASSPFVPKNDVPAEWDKIHPGLADDESAYDD